MALEIERTVSLKAPPISFRTSLQFSLRTSFVSLPATKNVSWIYTGKIYSRYKSGDPDGYNNWSDNIVLEKEIIIPIICFFFNKIVLIKFMIVTRILN